MAMLTRSALVCSLTRRLGGDRDGTLPIAVLASSQELPCSHPHVSFVFPAAHTRSPSTRLVRLRSSPRVSVVTTESKRVTVVRPSQSSTRRQRQQRRSSSVSSAQHASTAHTWSVTSAGHDCLASSYVGSLMPRILTFYSLTGTQAMQALRAWW